jgi:DNA-binding XRE family transcriptional regulator
VRVFRPIAARQALPLSPTLRRRRPRAYAEWAALRRWGRLPAWEESPPGYLLRAARETAGFTQEALARRLDCSQQAVAQAERADANPTLGFARRWAQATGTQCRFTLTLPDR